MRNQILQGDALEVLKTLPDGLVQCVVTSPPYWGLRDYGVAGQLGLEKTPEEFIGKMVEVFREVRRVMRDDGTLWLNMGDSYASCGRSDRKESPGVGAKQEMAAPGRKIKWQAGGGHNFSWSIPCFGTQIKPKDLCGIPWRVAFALQADGWWLRQDIIWAKPNPMPESCTDRCTKAHEYLFLLTKKAKYFYDAEAVKEGFADERTGNPGGGGQYAKECPWVGGGGQSGLAKGQWNTDGKAVGRNKRSVWHIATAPFPEAHFATFPPKLIEPCILAGTSEKGCCSACGKPWERVVEKTGEKIRCHWAPGTDRKTEAAKGKHGATSTLITGYKQEYQTTGWRPGCKCSAETKPCIVLDPFMGSGTTAIVAYEHGRDWLGIELSAEYAAMAERRVAKARAKYGLFEKGGAECER